MMPFLQLAAEKNTPFLVQLENFFVLRIFDSFNNLVKRVFDSKKMGVLSSIKSSKVAQLPNLIGGQN